MQSYLFARILLGFAALCLICQAAPSPGQLANLTHGTNATWFTGNPLTFDQPKARVDLDNLNKTGVRHVRLIMNPANFTRPDDPAALLPEALAEMTKAVAFAVKEGLAVIICPFHGTYNQRHRIPTAASPEAENMVRQWGIIAAHLANTDPNSVFLEIASEPSMREISDWADLQSRCAQAIRQAAPRHLIIATAPCQAANNRFDSLKNLVAMEPLKDDNVVYNFHYHGPTAFTFQGTGSVGYYYVKNVKDVPYPGRADVLDSLIASSTNSYGTDLLKAYKSGKWDRQRLRTELATAAEWAKRHKVHLTCNEFGANRTFCAPADRAAFLRDMSETMNELGIGWSVRGDTFGIFHRETKPYTLDAEAAQALGLIKP